MKGLRILLILFLIIALPIFPTFAETSSASAKDSKEPTIARTAELKMAAQEGFDTVIASDQTITGKQFIGLLDHYIEKTDNEKSVEWFQLLPNLRISDAPLLRCDAFVALCLAAETIGGHMMDLDDDWVDYHQKIGEGAWDTYKPSVALLGQDVLDAVSPVGASGWPRAAASYFFSFGRHSLLSGEKIFDYDSVTNSMNPDLPLNCTDALLAVSRLYFSNQQLPSELISLDDIKSLQLTDDQVALSAKMPDAAYNALPAWKGTALDNKAYKSGAHHTGEMFTPADFEILHDLGFNFTRIMITNELLFDLTDGVKVQQRELENLDDAIGYAIANGVHICICLADFPGFAGASMDDEGFSDPTMLANITTAYTILAKRYQTVPNSVLSFDLFNEPWKITKKREKAYVNAVHTVSEGIWQFGDRLIFVDGIAGSQEPVQSLAKEHYAQAFHMYLPDQFIYSGWVGETTWYAGEQWPLPYANGFLAKGASITLQGQFEEGTQVELLMTGNTRKGEIQLLADGMKVAGVALSNDETSGGKTLVLGQLGNAAGELKIKWNGSDHAQIQSLAVIYPEQDEKGTPVYSSPWSTTYVSEIDHRKMTLIYCDYGAIDGQRKTSTLQLHDDGTYSNETQAEYIYDKEYLRDFLEPWIAFQQKTGVGVMVQEWGTLDCLPKQASLNYINDWISLLDEYHIGWNLWCDRWQYLNTNRLDVQYEKYRGYRLDRDMVDTLMQNN